MPRIRLLSPKIFKDDDLSECSLYARWLFAGLPTIADREGRLEDRPRVIKSELLPYDDVDVDALLDELAGKRANSPGSFIRRYEVDGRRYIEICNFLKYQTPHHRECESVIPKAKALTGKAVPRRVPGTAKDGTSPSVSVSVPVSVAVKNLSDSDESALAATKPVHWDNARQAVELNEEWLRSELAPLSGEAGIVLTRSDFDYELEQLRLRCIADPRLRACLRKQNGKPSAPAQFKRMATLAVAHFSQAIRNKARHMPARASPPTFGQLKDIDTASRIEKARERDQRKEKGISQATKQLPKQ